MTTTPDKYAVTQAVAAEVRALMARHGKTQADVVRDLGIKPNATSFRWHGKTPWTIAELLGLCDWLDVDFADLLASVRARGDHRYPLGILGSHRGV